METKLIIDRVEIVGQHRHIQIRRRRVLTDDQGLVVGRPVGPEFDRLVLAPGDWDGAEAAEVTEYAKAAWTDEIIASYQAALPSQPEAV